MIEIVSKNKKQTEKIASKFAKTLKSGDFVALYGDLGAGKTVFSQSVIKTLTKSHAISPTFTLLNEYQGIIPVYHFDMYRLKSSQEIESVGYEDYFYGNGVCLVEWPERIINYLPRKRFDVIIQKVDDNTRKIQIVEKNI